MLPFPRQIASRSLLCRGRWYTVQVHALGDPFIFPDRVGGRFCLYKIEPGPIDQIWVGFEPLRPWNASEGQLQEWIPKCGLVVVKDVLCNPQLVKDDIRLFVKPAVDNDPHGMDGMALRQRCRYDLLRFVGHRLRSGGTSPNWNYVMVSDVLASPLLTRMFSLLDLMSAAAYWIQRAWFEKVTDRNDFRILEHFDHEIEAEIEAYEWEESPMSNTQVDADGTSANYEHDIFICHASEDKESFVRPLADALHAAGVRVWYDELTIGWGDSLRPSIDRGLLSSRFGIVVLSKAFFKKNWTEYELNGLAALERNGRKVVLPIWHGVTREDVLRYSPPLADRVAVQSDLPHDQFVEKVRHLIGNKDKKQGGLEGQLPDTSSGAFVVESSGPLVLLADHLFEWDEVRETQENRVIITIRAQASEQEAILRGLRPDEYGQPGPIPLAWNNTAYQAYVAKVESVSHAEGQVWTVVMEPKPLDHGGCFFETTYCTEFGNITPDDFARMRAGRLLLNDPPPIDDLQGDALQQAMLESHIQGGPVPVKACVLRELYAKSRSSDRVFLQSARLMAVYFIRLSTIAEQVLDLSLGPIQEGKVHVRFRGRRRRTASNVEASVVEVEGDCLLG